MRFQLILTPEEAAIWRDRIRRALVAPHTAEGEAAARELLGLAAELDAASGRRVAPLLRGPLIELDAMTDPFTPAEDLN